MGPTTKERPWKDPLGVLQKSIKTPEWMIHSIYFYGSLPNTF